VKRVLLIILIAILFLTSCSGNNEKRIKKKFDKILDKYTGYETELDLTIIGEEKDSVYKLRETYINENEIKIEVLEPKENNEIVIKYKGDNIYLKNTSIDQSISLNKIKEIDKSLLFGEIFIIRDSIDWVGIDTIDGRDYYIIEYNLEDNNRYNNKKIIYLNKEKFIPEQIIILDEDNKERLKIKYNNFEYRKN